MPPNAETISDSSLGAVSFALGEFSSILGASRLQIESTKEELACEITRLWRQTTKAKKLWLGSGRSIQRPRSEALEGLQDRYTAVVMQLNAYAKATDELQRIVATRYLEGSARLVTVTDETLALVKRPLKITRAERSTYKTALLDQRRRWAVSVYLANLQNARDEIAFPEMATAAIKTALQRSDVAMQLVQADPLWRGLCGGPLERL